MFVHRLLSPRPSLLNTANDARLNSSPQKPLDLKQLKQRAAAIPPIVSTCHAPAPTLLQQSSRFPSKLYGLLLGFISFEGGTQQKLASCVLPWVCEGHGWIYT